MENFQLQFKLNILIGLYFIPHNFVQVEFFKLPKKNYFIFSNLKNRKTAIWKRDWKKSKEKNPWSLNEENPSQLSIKLMRRKPIINEQKRTNRCKRTPSSW